jgi:hypothetical protein
MYVREGRQALKAAPITPARSVLVLLAVDQQFGEVATLR